MILQLNKDADKEMLWELRHRHRVAEVNSISTKEELVKFVVHKILQGGTKLYVWYIKTATRYHIPVPVNHRKGVVTTVGSEKNGWLISLVRGEDFDLQEFRKG